jgi:hypothetical protein
MSVCTIGHEAARGAQWKSTASRKFRSSSGDPRRRQGMSFCTVQTLTGAGYEVGAPAGRRTTIK